MRGKQFIAAIDFDGTIAEHEFPQIGPPVPGAIAWMRKFQELGASLLLWTMRSDGPEGDVLSQAIEFCRTQGVEFDGHNVNPTQHTWTLSPKMYAQVYIDDNAFGCPLLPNPNPLGRPYVDWSIVGPAVEEMILARR